LEFNFFILQAGRSFAFDVSSTFGPVSLTEYVPISSSNVVFIIRRLVPFVRLVIW
jgi:hypothetical protein